MILYRLALMLALPVLALAAAVAALRGRGAPGALAERLVRKDDRQVPEAPQGRLWLHGASLGELTSARWLIERLLAERPGTALIVTMNSLTARAMVRGWGLDRCEARLAPLDTPGAVGRFLNRWRPDALITLENEIWPERVAQCAERGLPVIWLGARLSARSATTWRRAAPRLIAATLGRMRLVSAQDGASEQRLVALGLPPPALGPRLMLKSAAGRAGGDPVPPFACPHPRETVLLAASTHEGEDEAILDAFRDQSRFALLILAPRHPERAAMIRAAIAARGLSLAQRSRAEAPRADTRVFLADTLGEMGQWYAMAGATIIGGTFADRGGHTPFEPAAHGSAILHGPSVHNFAEPFAALASAGAAIALQGPGDLAPALTGLAPAHQADLARRARDALPEDPAAGAVLAALLDALPPPSRG